MPMNVKPGRVVTYDEKLPSIKSKDPFDNVVLQSNMTNSVPQ